MARSEVSLWPVDPQGVVSSCRGCSARIIWSKTLAGKNIPLSIDSTHAVWQGDGAAATCVRAPSHFTDCPAANQFSGRNRK